MSKNFLLLCIGLLVTGASVRAQLTNDMFLDALDISGTYIEGRVALTNATSEAGEPLISGDFDHTAWYRWIAPETGAASFNAIGNSGKQVSAAVYFGHWPELRLINYALRTPSATLRFPVAKGQVIFLQLGRERSPFSSTRAESAIWSVALQTIGSVLDGISVASPATVESDSFSSPVVLSGELSSGISYPWWAEHGPTNPGEAGYNNSWYRWTAPHSGTVRVTCSTPWPFSNIIGPIDKKTVGVFTGPDLPNLTTVATAKGIGDIVATFEATESQTYYISVGKQTTDALLGWVITSLTLTPKFHSPLEIERAVRVRVETSVGKTYQLQLSSDLKAWENIGDPIEGTGEAEWIYGPTVDLKQSSYRVAEITDPQ